MNPLAPRVLLTPCIVAVLAMMSAVGPEDARARQGPPPTSFLEPLQPLTAVDMVVLPAVDVEALRAEDAATLATGVGGPARFAAPIPVSLSTASNGTWDTLADRSRIWRLRVVSPGAHSLNFECTRFVLPRGATVHFYAEAAVPVQAGGMAHGPASPGDPARDVTAGSAAPTESAWDGPYASADASPGGRFWTAVVPGDDALVELSVPAEAPFEPELVIGQVGHDYRGFADLARALTAPAGKQGHCNVDVICPQGDPWRDEIRSVGCYSLGGSMICTGVLVNSHDPDHPPYFLTAGHCGVNTSNDESMVVYWNFESPTCGVLGGGSLAQHQSGAEWMADYSASDFSLVRLALVPVPEFNVYYAGWDAREATTPMPTVCIHHPECEEKAISFCGTPLTTTSYLQTSVPGDGTHWRLDHWDEGTTEPGSSGGALWDAEHRVIGQLHGGMASCSSITADWFGRLAVSWNGGGDPSSRLRDWLDPTSSGELLIDGRNWNGSGPSGGACCHPNATCTLMLQGACQPPSIWQGAGTHCTPDPCAPTPIRLESWASSSLAEGLQIRWEVPLGTSGARYRTWRDPAAGHDDIVPTPDAVPVSSAWTGASADGIIEILDRAALRGTTVRYFLEMGAADARSEFIGSVEARWDPPSLPLLAGPTPFLGTVRFSPPVAGPARAEIFDPNGRLVRVLERAGGAASIEWNGCDDSGRKGSAGVYLVRISTSAGTRSTRVVLIR
jgi:hypothetical protein